MSILKKWLIVVSYKLLIIINITYPAITHLHLFINGSQPSFWHPHDFKAAYSCKSNVLMLTSESQTGLGIYLSDKLIILKPHLLGSISSWFSIHASESLFKTKVTLKEWNLIAAKDGMVFWCITVLCHVLFRIEDSKVLFTHVDFHLSSKLS